MSLDAGVRLYRRAQGQRCREGVVYEFDPFRQRIVRHCLGRGYSPDPARIDLNIAESRIIDHVLRLVKIVAAFTSSHFHPVRLGPELAISRQRPGHERFFQPQGISCEQGRQALCSLGNIIISYGSGIDEQHPIRAEFFSGRVHLICICRRRTAAVGSSSKFGGPKAGTCHLASLLKRALGVIAK